MPAPQDSPAATPSLSAAQAAKLVSREVAELGADGKPTGKTKSIPIKADEVFSHKDYGDHVVVVTVDGQKFVGEKPTK